VKTTLALACLALVAVGCGRQSPAQSIANLRSTDWEQRREAADDLRGRNGVPPEAVPHLMAALQHEKYPPAYGAMLITLGKSGVPDAIPYICGAVQSEERDMRRWGDRALDLWREKNATLRSCPPKGMPVAMIVPASGPNAATAARPR